MTEPIPTTDLSLADIKLSDNEMWIRPDRDGIFAKLRAEAPITFQDDFLPPPEMQMPQGPGYWALTRYADVMQVSRDPDTFHSAPSTTITDIPPEIAEFLGSMINMDAPKHTKLRLIVNRGFTPAPDRARRGERARAGARDRRARRADGRVRLRRRDRGGAPAPDHLRHDGHPAASDNKRIFELTNIILGVGDPEYVQTMEDLMGAGMELFQYGLELGRGPRSTNPTRRHHELAHARRGRGRERPSPLTSSELGSFFLLLVVAGNETTRNAISHGMYALHEPPGPARALDDDFDARRADRGRGDRALGDAGDPLPAHRDRATPRSAARRSRPATRS